MMHRQSVLTILLIVLNIMGMPALQAGFSEWAWMKGSDKLSTAGVYGIQGTPSLNNAPGSREGAASWTDSDGNLWLFGGEGMGESDLYNYPNLLNDLWKYNPTTQTWMWLKGNSTLNQNGIYAAQGIPGNSNMPGARTNAVTWIDGSGKLWLFGGYGYDAVSSYYGLLNDLWKFDPATNQWVWVKGSSSSDQTGVYGIQGTLAVTNNPGARGGAASWTDGDGNFWLFGGAGYAVESWRGGGLNDLWKYYPALNQWVWIKGNNSVNNIGIYGIQGVPASNNLPGGREGSSTWIEADGNLWLFGGYDETYPDGPLNDLWNYNPVSNQWTWIHGTTSKIQFGVYGTQGVMSPENMPGGRSNSVSWLDGAGNLWLFGGNGYGESGTNDQLNDLWMFNPIVKQWKWVKGSSSKNQLGIYGIQGISSPQNTPGARSNCTGWIGKDREFWLFGGSVYKANYYNEWMNDLWRFTPNSIPSGVDTETFRLWDAVP